MRTGIEMRWGIVAVRELQRCKKSRSCVLVGAPALESDGIERVGICPEFPRCLLRQLGGVETRAGRAPHRAEAGVRGRGREAAPGGCACRRCPRHGAVLERSTAQLRAAEVVGGRKVELCARRCGLREGPLVRGAGRCWRAGPGAGGRRLVEVGQAAGLGAVGGAVGLLVAGEAELVCPVERHGDCCVCVRVCGVVEGAEARKAKAESSVLA